MRSAAASLRSQFTVKGFRMGVNVMTWPAAGLWALAFFSASVAGAPLQCRPLSQVTCGEAECTRQTEGFQHAESFSFDPASQMLGACLWTRCYSAKAQVFRATPKSAEVTAMAVLVPENRADQHEPLVVSLTIDAARRFVAVWQYRADGLVFDQGACAPAK